MALHDDVCVFIAYHASDRIARTTHGHQKLVVVTVTIDIVALAVHLTIAFFAEKGAAKTYIYS